MLANDDELFRPTLGAQDDHVDFDKPFDPMSVLIVVALCKPLAGTLLIALNAQRLGLRRQIVPLALSGLLLTLVWLYGIYLYVHNGGRGDVSEIAGFVYSLSGALVALAVLRSHKRRFRINNVSDGEVGNLWPFGIGCYVIGRILHVFAVAPAFEWFLKRALNA